VSTDADGWRSEDDTDWFYEVRVAADRALGDEDAKRLFALIGYAFRSNLRGEDLGGPDRVSDRCWTGYYDITKSRSDDWGFHIGDALADARRFAVGGTPPRKTARTGPVGSRLIEGLGEIGLVFSFR
jgi:hypothetical protein